MKKIPLFSLDEINTLIPRLARVGISAEIEAVTGGISMAFSSGTSEFYLLVSSEQYVDALVEIMDEFCIEPETEEGQEGECPACYTEIGGALECPGCGLSFAGGISDAVRVHPFYKYLQENNLLPF